jgi:hypothetical protein
MPAVPQDENLPAADLPKGSVEAVILDGQQAPMPGVEVHLAILFSKISEGENKSERVLRSDAEGRVRFDGLTAASEYSYRIVVASSGAEYTSGAFNLNERVGQRIRLHVFPVTHDIRSAMVGMRGFVYVEPRDEVFVFDVVYYVFNIGTVTWVPENVVLRLPEGFKAFSTQKGESDASWEVVEGQGARLKGTFTPGRENVGFRFQLPKIAESTVNFRIGALPRTAELRVIAAASSQMHLSVEGFEEPQVSSNQQGNRVLVTRRLLQRGDELDGGVSITIDGIPVPGNGRWVALAIAAALAAVGLASARGYMRLDPSDLRQDQDLQSARELLLHELLDVERARRDGQLGPRAHAEARRTLLDALARLGRDVLAPAAPRKKRRRAAA